MSEIFPQHKDAQRARKLLFWMLGAVLAPMLGRQRRTPAPRFRGWMILLFVAGAGELLVKANPVEYTSSYVASVVPEVSSPEWAAVADRGAAAQINSEPALEATTLENPLLLQYWVIGTDEDRVYGDSSAWNTDIATIDFKVRVEASLSSEETDGAQGFWIQVADASRRCWNFYISKDAIYQKDIVTGVETKVEAGSLSLDPGVFNVYRIVLSSGFASFYVNDNPGPVFENLVGTAGPERTALMFGDAASFQASAYVLSFLKWSNVEAESSAPLASLKE